MSMTNEALRVWQCFYCGYVYDEARGDAAEGLAAGTRWADIPDDWICPECGAAKADFQMVDVTDVAAQAG